MQTRIRAAIGCAPGSGRRSDADADADPDPAGDRMRPRIRPAIMRTRIRPAIGCDPGPGRRSDADPDADRFRSAIGCAPDPPILHSVALQRKVASVRITTIAKSFGLLMINTRSTGHTSGGRTNAPHSPTYRRAERRRRYRSRTASWSAPLLHPTVMKSASRCFIAADGGDAMPSRSPKTSGRTPAQSPSRNLGVPAHNPAGSSAT